MAIRHPSIMDFFIVSIACGNHACEMQIIASGDDDNQAAENWEGIVEVYANK